jgi:hypothetical protein
MDNQTCDIPLILTEKSEQIGCQLFFVRGEQAMRRTVIFD